MQKDVSIIIPVKDEEENIPVLAGEIGAAMGKTNFSWECVWVDDGSADTTLERIKTLHHTDSRHRYLSLTRNFGQSAAMMAGFKNAMGNILVTIDGDGQNDPEDIPGMVHRLVADRADMVNGRRKNRQDTLVRKISSRIANAYRNRMTGESVSDVGCSLRAIRRECVEQIILFKGMHRFIPTLVRMSGYTKIIEVPVNHRPRKLGTTKYGIHNRLWVGLADTFAVRWMQNRLVFPNIKEKND
jgi:dolichol-phosphate mannosyltransferase